MYKKFKFIENQRIIENVFKGLIIIAKDWRLDNHQILTLLDVTDDDYSKILQGIYPKTMSQDKNFRYHLLLKFQLHISAAQMNRSALNRPDDVLDDDLITYAQSVVSKMSDFGILVLLSIFEHEKIEI